MDFDSIWQVLLANGTNPRRQDEASAAWARYTPQQQQQIYNIICDRIKHRKFVAYIPTQAFVEASRLVTDGTPTNYNGRALPDEPLVRAVYNGVGGLYTRAEAQLFNMQIIGEFKL